MNNLKKAYSNLSKIYPFIEGFIEKNIRKKSLELLNIKTNETVLEIGFGTGFALVDLAKSVGKNGKVYGLDITPEIIRIAKNRAEKLGLTDRVKFFEGDARKLPFKNNFFDCVYISETLELFNEQDRKIVLSEIKRVLKKYGQICVISVPLENNENYLIINIYSWFYRRFPEYTSQVYYVDKTITKAGFKIIKKETVKIFFIFPMKIVIAKNN